MAMKRKCYVHSCEEGCGVYENDEIMSMCSCCGDAVLRAGKERSKFIDELNDSQLKNDEIPKLDFIYTADDTKTLPQTTTEERNKVFDINRLKEMVAKIVQFEKGKIELKTCLWSVAKLSGGITLDGEIWNKYGNDQQGKKDSQDRLPFRKLFHIKNIFDDHQTNSLITEEVLQRLEEDVGHLKDKAVRILRSEHCDNMEHVTESVSTGSISNILELSDKYFEMLTAKLIKTEIFIWESIEQLQKRPVDFNIKDDRYFIARLLCKIGELLKEFTNGLDVSKQGKSSRNCILRAFKNLIKIRNRFFHDCEVIVEGIKDQNGVNTGLLATILDHMRKLFCQPSRDRGQLSINYQYENATKFEKDSDKLLRYFSGKQIGLEDCTKCLDDLIMEASNVIKENEDKKSVEERLSPKDLKKQRNKLKNNLENINKQYQPQLKEIKEFGIHDYPPAINLENKDCIMEKRGKLKNDIKIPGDNKEKVNKRDYAHLRQIELKYFRSMLNEEHVLKMNLVYTSFMLDHVVIFTEYIRDTFASDDHYLEVINIFHLEYFGIRNTKQESNEDKEQLWDEALSKLRQYQFEINKEFEEKFPELYSAFRATHDDSDIIIIQNKLRNIFKIFYGNIMGTQTEDTILHDFHSEFFFHVYKCVELDLVRFPDLKKYDYILQQIVLHNLQLTKDSESSYNTLKIPKGYLVKVKDFERISSYHQKCVSSRYMKRGIQLSKGYRSGGLAHNVLSFNNKVFYDDTIDDSLTLSKYLQCLTCILNSSNLSTAWDLCDAADAFSTLYLHNESLDLWKRALEVVETYPEEVEKHDLDEQYLKIFQKPRFVCIIFFNTISLLTILNRYENMFQNLETFIDNINTEELSKSNTLEIKHFVSNCYCGYAEYLQNRGNLSRAVEYLEKADSIGEGFHTKYNLSLAYYHDKQYDKARNLCKHILDKINDADCKIYALSLLIVCDSENPKTSSPSSEMRGYIDQMKTLRAKSKRYFKDKLLGNYRLLDALFLDSSLEVIISKYGKEKLNENDLRELIEIDKMFHEIKNEIDAVGIYRNMIANFYLRLCQSYCLFYNEGKLISDEPEKYLKIAYEYFIIAFAIEQSWKVENKIERSELQIFCRACAERLIAACNNYVVEFTGRVDPKFLIDFLSDMQDKYPDLSDTLTKTSVSLFVSHDMNNVTIEELVRYISLLDLEAKSRAINEGNLHLLKNCLSFYYMLLNLMLLGNEKLERLPIRQNKLIYFLCNLTEALLNILNHECCSSHLDELVIFYCRNKWKIEISNQDKEFHKEWKYEGDLSNEELMKIIKTELSCVGELFVIYIFIMGYYKQDRD